MIADAGLELIDERRLVSTVSAPQDAATHEFIARHLAGTVRDLSSVAEHHDIEALRKLVDTTRPFPRRPMERCRGHLQPTAVHRQIEYRLSPDPPFDVCGRRRRPQCGAVVIAVAQRP